MKINKILILASAALLGACQVTTPTNNEDTSLDLAQILSFDSSVEVGKLENGLSYYIAENTNPESRVYVRLVVNAGSMNEDDDQRGVAHIVEHMAFNGTEHYPGNDVIKVLEEAGMKFGVDINAFTDFENTVYTLNLPSNDPETLELVMDILSDWASNVTMLKGDLDAERGIVLEEWRARLGPMLRLGDKKSAIEMAGSRYVTRDPIGDPHTIQNVSKYRVADFYNRWYRPDNMSVVVVGDVQTEQVKQLITQKMGDANAPESELEKIDYSIPLVDGWRSEVVSEEGYSSPSVEVSFFSTFEPDLSFARYQQDLAHQIATRLLNVRLQRWEQDEDNVVNAANFYSSNVGRETTQAVFSLQLVEGEYQQATQGLFQFVAQLAQQGFSEAEVNGEISRLQGVIKRGQDKKNYSIDLAGDLMVAAASGQILVSKDQAYELNKYFLDRITLQQVNEAFLDIIEPKSRLVLLTQPTDKRKPKLASEWVESEWQMSMHTMQQPWVVDDSNAVLPVVDPKPGTLKQEKKWAEHRITEYRLSNGSKLVYRYSDSNPGQVHFKALTEGGLRSIPQSDYQALRTAVSLVDDTGVGEVSQADIQTIFRGNPVVMSTLVGDYQQGFSGWAKTDSFEKMLKLFHLKLASSPVSEKSLKEYQVEMEQRLNGSQFDGADRFVRKVSELRFPGIPTVYSDNGEQAPSYTTEKLSDVYQTYIAGKTDYTYFVVGDISANELEQLAARYLSSIEVKEPKRTFYDVKASSPMVRYSTADSKEPRAEVEIYLTQDSQWRPDNAYYLELSGELVQEQLRLKLREQASGVYGVASWFWQDVHSPQAEGRILFTCAPERVDELISLTHSVLSSVAKQGADEQVLENKLVQRDDQIDRYLRSDLGMLNAMEQSYLLTDSPRLIQAQRRANSEGNKAKVDAIMRQFLSEAERFEAVLLPEVSAKTK
ncbi:M16 family metallopeptidase [Vibrio sp. THAF190c]|uniref:M16 family metallopeptidase n=1 Tax=Vibrio sp. THAF190c TaxID=2587865 RepID=UPI0012698689|nr:M16 family metallopeptidase [Vibrio sp. THAF190c]QFT10116.1 Insulinase (Peptidase family M16) [Vibrio sp. THAF190c]